MASAWRTRFDKEEFPLRIEKVGKFPDTGSGAGRAEVPATRAKKAMIEEEMAIFFTKGWQVKVRIQGDE